MQKSRYHIWPRTRTCKINTELFKVCFIQLRWLVHPRPPWVWLEWGLDACWHGRPGDGEHDLVFSQRSSKFLSSFLKSGDHLVLTNCLDKSSLDHETHLVHLSPLSSSDHGCRGLSILRTGFQPFWIQNFENHTSHDVKQVGERATGYGVSLLNSLFGTASKAALLQVIKYDWIIIRLTVVYVCYVC